MGTDITFKRLDGQTAAGYLANAAAGTAPGVVVIQEWWGLQGQIKGICDRLALAGFTALAPDLYRGTVVPYHDREQAGKAMQSLDFLDATAQTVRGAADYLEQNGGKVGIIGFCMGGAVAVIAAARLTGLSAAVSFYGLPPREAAAPAEVAIPLQGHFASRDDWCAPAVVDGFEAELTSAGKVYEIFRYEADHAFMNEQRAGVHDRHCAEQAWDRATRFLNRHLR